MVAYRVFFRESVDKDLRLIPKEDVARIIGRIGVLAVDPRPPGCQKLSDQEKYRVRQGRYRILYSLEDDEHSVWIVKVAHRKDVYR